MTVQIDSNLIIFKISLSIILYRGVDNYSVWGGGISSVSVMGDSPGDVSENL